MPVRIPTNIQVGRRYRLRNGALVTAVERRVYRWRDAAGRAQQEPWFILAADHGGRSTCLPGGTYAPPGVGVHPHELDIVARVFGG